MIRQAREQRELFLGASCQPAKVIQGIHSDGVAASKAYPSAQLCSAAF